MATISKPNSNKRGIWTSLHKYYLVSC